MAKVPGQADEAIGVRCQSHRIALLERGAQVEFVGQGVDSALHVARELPDRPRPQPGVAALLGIDELGTHLLVPQRAEPPIKATTTRVIKALKSVIRSFNDTMCTRSNF